MVLPTYIHNLKPNNLSLKKLSKMKRRAPKSTDKLHDEESRFSNLLFNKSDKLVQKLKSQKNDGIQDDIEHKPAWVDEDDTNFEANIIPNVKSKALYVDKLKQKYETLMGTPNWARLDKNYKPEDEHDRNNAVLRRVGHIHTQKVVGLKKEYLELRKFSKINYRTGNEGPQINCIEFHPKSTVALVGGQAGIASLFSVGRDVNDKIHSFKLKGWKITTADFTPSGNEAYLSSSKIHNFCVYDLVKAVPQLIQLPRNVKTSKVFKLSPDGKYIALCDGFDLAYIICSASKELLKVLKHNSNIASLTFNHDSTQLYSFGKEGEVTIWDLSTYKSVKKFYDHGCVKASRIAVSPCGRLLATGSKEGIVNIYQTADLNSAEPLPHKTISNLTTRITTLKFNPTTEILAIASCNLENAAKLVHIPSYQVFTNFPKQDDTLAHVNVMNFSPNGGYMGLGNNKECALLYRLKYYKNY